MPSCAVVPDDQLLIKQVHYWQRLIREQYSSVINITSVQLDQKITIKKIKFFQKNLSIQYDNLHLCALSRLLNE